MNKFVRGGHSMIQAQVYIDIMLMDNFWMVTGD